MATIQAVQTAGHWSESAGRSGFGQWLKQARDARGLTLDDISRETKIPRRNLEALEHGNLGVVPLFYQRAEVRAIARAVGIDEGVAVGRLDTAITPAVEPRKPGLVRARVQNTQGAAVALTLGIALAVVALAWISFDRLAMPPGDAGSEAAGAPSAAAVAPPAETATVEAATQQPAAATPQQPIAEETTSLTATPEVQAAEFTEIVVRTEPSGAHVTVNGIGWGTSPVTIRHLPPGEKRIRATKEGFGAAERLLSLGDGQRLSLDLRLTAK